MPVGTLQVWLPGGSVVRVEGEQLRRLEHLGRAVLQCTQHLAKPTLCKGTNACGNVFRISAILCEM